MEEKIKQTLDNIRPALQADGGDLRFVKFSDGVLEIELVGACAGCPMAQLTLKDGIEVEVMKAVPEVKEVVAV
ncbi:NifU family protein [Patescibacteria group bacterium]|nr:NifU family protein [Patescibacteria group bacterium]